MSNNVKIAIDAMGGENSPGKIINGIDLSLKLNQNNFFYLYGNEMPIKKLIDKKKNLIKYCEIINTENVISDNESPFSAAKKGKKTSMWKAVESQKINKCDISLSAGNTGALLIISKLILNTNHILDTSIIDKGCKTRTSPKSHVNIMAGFIINLNSLSSIRIKLLLVSLEFCILA